jgi:hypothetical protein
MWSRIRFRNTADNSVF